MGGVGLAALVGGGCAVINVWRSVWIVVCTSEKVLSVTPPCSSNTRYGDSFLPPLNLLVPPSKNPSDNGL